MINRNHMKYTRLIYSIAFSAALLSCSGQSITDRMDKAEKIMHECPDSALSILSDIDRNSIPGKHLKARYALLYSMVLDKNYIDTTDVSVIMPAVEYYSKRNNREYRSKSRYYLGRIYANRNEIDNAMVHYMEALEDTAGVSDIRYKELLNSAVSDIFSMSQNSLQEYKYAHDALRYGKQCGDKRGIWALTGHLATCSANILKWKESDSLFTEFFSMPVIDTASYINRAVSYSKINLLKPEPEPQKSIDMIVELQRRFRKPLSMETYCIYAYAEEIMGRPARADAIMDQLRATGISPDILERWNYRIYKHQGKNDKAIKLLEKSIEVQDSTILTLLDQSLVSTQRNYYSSQAELLKKEHTMQVQRLMLISAVLIICLLVMLFLFFSVRMRLTRKIEEISTLHLEVKKMLDSQKQENSKVRKQFMDTYKNQFHLLNDLCAAYWSPVKKDKRDYIYEQVMDILRVIDTDVESQSKFENDINNSLDNIMVKLRADLPNHKEADFRFIQYIIAGFEAKTIANIMGYSVASVYTKKNRIKSEISKIESPNKILYETFIY